MDVKKAWKEFFHRGETINEYKMIAFTESLLTLAREEERKRIAWCIRDRAEYSPQKELGADMIAQYIEENSV